MNTDIATTCPECGQPIPVDAPGRLCPRCLAAGAFSDDKVPKPESSSLDPDSTVHIILPEESSLPAGAPRKLGEYELVEEIAVGGMGIVYKAWQPGLERFVAVKTIRSGLLATPADVERFQREAKAAARLRHPNIVAIHEIGEQDGQHYFAMDYVAGENLATLARKQPLLPEQAAQITAAVAGAIHYAHQEGVLHRDLKPANVILGPDGPRVLDFGLARLQQDDSQLTQSGTPMGSPCYMSPEQAAGKVHTLDARTDVYALGAMLYELLTGRPPFQAASVMETLRLVQETEAVPLRRINPSLPADLETICLKCLEKEPAKRYATAQELADELSRFLRDEPIHARPVSVPEKLLRWCRRKPALAGSVASLILVLVLGFAGVLWQWHRAERNAEREQRERQRAEVGELAARRNAYAADMNLAMGALAAGNWTEARELVERYLPTNQSAARGVVGEIDRDLRGWEWRYLWGQTRSDELFTLGTHERVVNRLAFSPDGKRLASADRRGEVKVWDLEGRRQLASAVLHSNDIQTMAFSSDGQFILTAGWDGTLLVSRADTLESAGLQQQVAGDRLALMGEQTSPTALAPPVVEGFAFMRDGKGLLTLCKVQDTVQAVVWDWPTRHETKRMVLSGMDANASFALALAPDDRTVAVAADDELVWLWDLERGSKIGQLTGHEFTSRWGRQIWKMSFSTNGLWLATASSDQTARVWDMTSLELVAVLRHSALVLGAVFSADGRTLATSSRDQTIKLWDWKSQKELATLRGHRRDAMIVCFTPDGTRLVTGGRDGAVKVWDSDPKPMAQSYFPLPPGHRDPHLLLGNAHLVTHGTKGQTVWSLSSLQPVHRFDAETNVIATALSPKADRRALYRGDGSLRVHELATGREIIMADTKTLDSVALCWSPDATMLAAIYGGELQIWEVATGKSMRRIERTSQQFELGAFSPDNRLLVVPISFGLIEVWELATGRKRVLAGHQGSVSAVAFAPDGRRFATPSTDGTVKLWSPDSPEPLATFRSRASRYDCVAFSRDGTRIVAGSFEESLVQVWDLETKRELGALKGHSSGVTSVAFLDDNTVVSVGMDGVRFWRAPTLAEIDARQPVEILNDRRER